MNSESHIQAAVHKIQIKIDNQTKYNLQLKLKDEQYDQQQLIWTMTLSVSENNTQNPNNE